MSPERGPARGLYLLARSADTNGMVVLARVMAAFFAICGITIAAECLFSGSGFEVAIIGTIFGAIIASGAVPFLRAARRMKRDLADHPLTPERRRSRRRTLAAVVAFCAITAASAIVLPMPGGLGPVVVMLIAIVLVLPLLLIDAVDPTKRKN